MRVSRRRFLGLVGGAGSVGLAGCSTVGFGGDDPTPTPSPVSTPWPMYRYDPQNTGVTEASGPTAPVTRQWEVQFSAEVSTPLGPQWDIRAADEGHIDWMSPTVVGSTVYVGVEKPTPAGAHVYALSIADGSTQWRYPIDESQTGTRILSTPAVGEDTVYAANDRGSVYALDPVEDTEKWDVGVNDDLPWVRIRARNYQWRAELRSDGSSSPAVVDGTVYLTSSYGTAFALDAADGTIQWRTKLSGNLRSPAVADDTVYVGAFSYTDDPPVEIASGTVHALAAADDTEQWRYTLEDRAPRAVAVANDTVYVSTRSDTHNPNTLYALAAADGTEQWTTQPVATAPAVTDDTVYVGSADGSIHAVRVADGSHQWRYNLGSASGNPVVAGDTVYVGGDGIFALGAADGRGKWTTQGWYSEHSSPAVVDGTVYVIGGNDNVYTITEA